MLPCEKKGEVYCQTRIFSTASFLFQSDVKVLPSITYPNIVNYLVFTPSPFTAKELTALKSLEAYNQACNGWVSDVLWKEINTVVIIKAKVRSTINFD